MDQLNDELVWSVRAFIYARFAETAAPPDAAAAAHHFSIPIGLARSLYHELHRRHAVFLEPGTDQVCMAFPFSAVETPFRVQANGITYFANCAWDSLGIPAALHADAQIEAQYAGSGEPAVFTIRGGDLSAPPARVHFAVPFARWYEDLVFT